MFNLNELFGQSPFRPLHEHMIKVKDCVDLLPELSEAFLECDCDKVYSVFQKICKLEHKADIVKQEIRNQLPKRYFLPVDRGDVFNFLLAQDAIADAIEDVAVLLTLRKTVIPGALKPDFKELIEKTMQTCVYAFEVSGEINKLAETGFGGYEASRVSELIEKVGESEWQADKAQMNLSKKLFEIEKELDPVTIIFIDKIIVRVGKIANNAETTADMMRNLLSKK